MEQCRSGLCRLAHNMGAVKSSWVSPTTRCPERVHVPFWIGCSEPVRRYPQGCVMLKHLLNEVMGHFSGLSDAQLEQIEQALPATKALIDLLNKAHPIIEQVEALYAEAQPLIDQARREWQTVGPAAQTLIDVISHHLNQGSSPAEAAQTVRAALGGTMKNVVQD